MRVTGIDRGAELQQQRAAASYTTRAHNNKQAAARGQHPRRRAGTRDKKGAGPKRMTMMGMAHI